MGRYRKPLAASYTGLTLLGATGGAALALLSAAMFLFRSECEPILRFVLRAFSKVRHYTPETYYFWAGSVGLLAVLWLALFLGAITKKPAEDRHVDAALRRRLKPTIRGAPIEDE